MKNKQLVLRAVLHSLGLTLYVLLLSSLLFNASSFLGEKDNFLSPVLALLTFVFSALVCGSLVLAKPILLYLDGKKKEALKLFFYTGAALFVFLMIVVFIMRLIRA